MDSTLIQQAIQQTKIRKRLKLFVEEYNAFVLLNHRAPRECIEEEAPLCRTKKRYISLKNLNEDEINYLQQNLIKDYDIRFVVKNFAEEYIAFIEENGVEPHNVKNPVEKRLMAKASRYTNPDNLNEYEIKYLKSLNIIVTNNEEDKIRVTLKLFVKEYNEFVEKNNRNPIYNPNDAFERNLYMRAFRYFKEENGFNLNDLEKAYLDENVRKISIRAVIITFVEEYKQFVDIKHREPLATLKHERALYNRIKRYTNSANLNQDEIDYLEQNGISVIMDKKDNIRRAIKQFVNDYTQFIKSKGVKPTYKSTDKTEVSLYLKFITYTNSKNITDEEREYLLLNGIKCRDGLLIKI